LQSTSAVPVRINKVAGKGPADGSLENFVMARGIDGTAASLNPQNPD
jgi:hypothetical protein